MISPRWLCAAAVLSLFLPKSPEGREIESWTREAGYVFQLVTEKLAAEVELSRSSGG